MKMLPLCFPVLFVLMTHLPVTVFADDSPEKAGEKILQEWTFEKNGDSQGWNANVHLKGVTVSNGVWSGRTTGADPILDFRPKLEIPASPWQVIEVRLKADHEGTAEFFWSNTTQGRYGGFEPVKTTRFHVNGDNQWHTYRLLPFWHPEKKIVRLRFDLYDGTQFELDSIRILELGVPPAAEQVGFDFTGADGINLRWQGFHGAVVDRDANGLVISTIDSTGFALGPPLRVDAAQDSFVSIRMAVTSPSGKDVLPGSRKRHATLYFATEQARGLNKFSFPVEADGRERTYNLDLLAAKDWNGRIVALGLRPADANEARACVRWLRVSDTPQGEPQLQVVSCALEDALPRTGNPATLSLLVCNTGGQSARNLEAELKLPKGVTVLSKSPADGRVASVGFGEETAFTWKVQAAEPLTGEAELHIKAANAGEVVARAKLAFTQPVSIKRTGYVPEPKPVRGTNEVGVYYFPGWKSASQWQPIQRFPERKPVLGWYREGDPEVADWHIKWAVEHGITFFAYDWYWSQGSRHLEHGLHDGYFKARYRNLLKFCLLWANHNGPHTSSHDDCIAVTRYWIENYFRRPEHLTIGGKPVMIIFSPHRLTEDLGSAGVKKAFDAMRAECRQAGLKGLHFVACVGNADGACRAAAEGYDSVTAYNWPGLNMSGTGYYAPFETLLEGYRKHWAHIGEKSPIPLLPVPVCGGWDSRPWHGDNNLVRYGRTPELFRQHLQDAKLLIESGQRKVENGNMILVEAWNEWGEGSYIEPHNEFGFGYLDAIRDVFTDAPKEHVDVTPVDAGVGPYDVPPAPAAQTAWSFDSGDEGWTHVMGLTDMRVQNGVLGARSTGRDPAFFSPPMKTSARDFNTVRIRMKLQKKEGQEIKDRAQLFWRTNRMPESEASSERFDVSGDGQWHDYVIPVAKNPRWRGFITRLRLDPCNQADVFVEIDSVSLAAGQ
ncbi:MAG: glycoside hydrolase family 99-like domain-containing protein [Kiritimatiellae bacterium]|nr:glycoside hydrolase family 99-like domain-containing protein [Kiritimatiellia bacterium]MDD5522083.1 glycoside hydrolase family 99-like domain-containing protein [Kiritimatiellia bacterium]